jgi:hypothetical protein
MLLPPFYHILLSVPTPFTNPFLPFAPFLLLSPASFPCSYSLLLSLALTPFSFSLALTPFYFPLLFLPSTYPFTYSLSLYLPLTSSPFPCTYSLSFSLLLLPLLFLSLALTPFYFPLLLLPSPFPLLLLLSTFLCSYSLLLSLVHTPFSFTFL